MNIKNHKFVTPSQSGRNSWWTYIIMALASLSGIIIFNQLMNRLLIPALKNTSFLATVGQDNISYVLIGLLFIVLYIIPKVGHRLLHHRPFRQLINTNGKPFRWKLYMKGMLQWGILLFISQLVTDFALFEAFIDNFQWSSFLITFVLSAFGLFIQTYWEELIFRGYLLQNIGRKFVALWVPNLIIAALFALAHFGYGFSSLLSSGIYSVFLVFITLKDEGIERASGIHFMNNFLLLNFFVNISAVTNSTFDWTIDWLDLLTLILSACIILQWSKAFDFLRFFGHRKGTATRTSPTN